MSEVKRMTFGSRCPVMHRGIPSEQFAVVWFAPERGRWLLETLKGGWGGGFSWDLVGVHLLDREKLPDLERAAVEGRVMQVAYEPTRDASSIGLQFSELGRNRIEGSLGTGALADGVPLEADQIVFGQGQVLVLVMQNMTGAALMRPISVAAICRQVEL